MRRSLLLLALLALLAACADDDPAPTVHVVAASTDQLDPANDLADDLRILVEYEDADGDLGEGVARVHDCRAEALLTELPIPAIADTAMLGEHIQGSLDLFVTDVGAAAAGALPPACAELGIAPLAADETVFCVVLVDAAGHAGTGDCTDAIAVAP